VADRWHWDFEDDEGARVTSMAAPPAGPPPPSGPPGEPTGGPHRIHRVQIRRRRAVALLAGLAGLAVLIVALAQDHRRAAAQSHATVRGSRLPLPSPAPAPQPENDKQAAVASVLAYTPFVKVGAARKPEVALTFDDGPGPYTPLLLNQLHRLHMPATFFEIGFMIRWFHASLTRELQMGDVIGDHTENHPMMALLSPAAQQRQIVDQTESLGKYGAPFPRLWRPPYGSYNQTTLAILHHLHMLMVLWTVDTNDYLRPGVAIIVHRTLTAAKPGAIILMHDAGGDRTQTIAALPKIVRALRQHGYHLVTIPQLILDDPPQHTEQLPNNVAGD